MSIQPLDQDYVDGLFTELGSLEVQLDADPLIYGPKRLNNKIALSRKMITRCERIFLDVSQKLATYKRAFRQAELVLDLEKKNLLANDPETRAGRAVSEREAIATGKLKAEVQAVFDATYAVEELEAVMLVVKAKRSDLRDAQGRLKDQYRLCLEEIGLGARWGSKSPRGTELEPGQGFADGADVAEVDDLIQHVRSVSDAETHLAAEVDDSDPEEEIEDDLASSADLPEDDLGILDEDPPAPPVKVQPPVVVPGTELVKEFGFVPHCEACGEMQSRTLSGMTCPNGHGGAGSISPEEASKLLPEESEEPAAADVLPGTSDKDEVAAFLNGDAFTSDSKALSRRQVEEENEDLDLDSILANWEG